MKNFLMVLSVFVSLNSFAAIDCPVNFESPNYAEKVQQLIESKKDCTGATEITEACAMGSSMDVQFVHSALRRCTKRINRSESVKKAVDSANVLCSKKFSKSEGTFAMSARAFCQLDVAKLYDNLLTPAEF
jgi:hypothetical protein